MNGRKELQEVWTEADSSKSLDTALREAPAGIGCWERLGGFGQVVLMLGGWRVFRSSGWLLIRGLKDKEGTAQPWWWKLSSPATPLTPRTRTNSNVLCNHLDVWSYLICKAGVLGIFLPDPPGTF